MTSSFIIMNYNELETKLWNDFVDSSDDCWLFHRSELIDLNEQLGNENLSFAIFNNGKIIFICPIFLHKKRRYLGLLKINSFKSDMGMGAAGIAFAPNLSQKVKLKIWEIALEYLVTMAKKYSALCFDVFHATLSNNVLNPSTEYNNPYARFGFCNRRAYGFDTTLSWPTLNLIVDLSKSTKQLYSNISKTGKHSIKKAVNNEIKLSVNPENYKESFQHILYKTYERTGASKATINFYDYISTVLHKKGFCDFLFADHPDKERVAGVVVMKYKNNVNYFAGGSLIEYLDMGTNYFLQWEIIKRYRSKNYKFYELGRYFPHLPKTSKQYGIGTFKRKMGPIETEIWQGSLLFNPNKYMFIFGLLGLINSFSFKNK